ncbi:MAG: hypothetical protein A3D31_07220 [Candidatus Fluviicola riflensis]|nr:MAG: hypothetical protein CHH17_07790 [Candidatus Fluviicola riflensis]OGS79741.1 MAG: hypothetical protein A3D31_07220 [Candidatus Fluviicola riflensis]OGS87174.1 MAG: hypothetical protein A2724_06680 [Fluviicola sp. RIFCSPHIGHO2_01_FULL_43_53]OGS89962.1 MAG: hypothetical protein A3E30_03425 [Fluviicola sp. RIFCSPHIGHO2_12_FULL_43_24]
MTDFGKIHITQKTGDEPITYHGETNGVKLIDFWKWDSSDIISNSSRGRFAEFIVASALKIDFSTVRNEWNPYDLETPEGIKVEVKSASYLQSWSQKNYSPIAFSIKEAKCWDSATGVFSETAKRHADIYVFCLLKHKDQLTLNPMNLEQWEFFVLPTETLNNYPGSKSSITLSSLQKLTSAIVYPDLKQAIEMLTGKT